MGVRGIRRPKESSSEEHEVGLLFTGVESLLRIAEQKNLYDGDRLDIVGLIKQRDDILIKYDSSLDPSISGETLSIRW